MEFIFSNGVSQLDCIARIVAACLCGALVLLSGCGAANTQEEALQKVTVGEVTHSVLIPPKR